MVILHYPVHMLVNRNRNSLASTASTPDIGRIIGQVAGGGVAGALLTAIVGATKNKTA